MKIIMSFMIGWIIGSSIIGLIRSLAVCRRYVKCKRLYKKIVSSSKNQNKDDLIIKYNNEIAGLIFLADDITIIGELPLFI